MAAATLRKILPTLDRVLVKRAQAVTATKGGIVIPEKAAKKGLEATVVAVGPGAKNMKTGGHIPPVFKVGDRVLLPEYGGTRVNTAEEQEFFLFREPEILAKIE